MPPADPKPADAQAKKDPHGKPSKTEHDKLKQTLMDLGVKPQDVKDYVGLNAGDMTRAQIVQVCIAKCKSHPRKV